MGGWLHAQSPSPACAVHWHRFCPAQCPLELPVHQDCTALEQSCSDLICYPDCLYLVLHPATSLGKICRGWVFCNLAQIIPSRSAQSSPEWPGQTCAADATSDSVESRPAGPIGWSSCCPLLPVALTPPWTSRPPPAPAACCAAHCAPCPGGSKSLNRIYNIVLFYFGI